MIPMIDCFIPFRSGSQVSETLEGLRGAGKLFLVCTPASEEPALPGYAAIETDSLRSTHFVRAVAAAATAPYTLIYTKYTTLRFGAYSLERLCGVARDTGAVLTYSDHFDEGPQGRTPAPVIDYQEGSVRDDFNFGSVMLFRTDALKEAVSGMDRSYQHAGLYDLRLRVSRLGRFEHVSEFLYYDIESDRRTSGEKLFDYVDPRNRAAQIEMEAACTEHLKAIGAYLAPEFKDVDFHAGGDFRYEATVVIPCKNRVRTIGDALASALSQQTDFPYNVMVVDDNSDDGTVEVIQSFLKDPKLIYIAQDKTWHGIGGNWNAALHHPDCGRFALQLDSDDVYSDAFTVQKFVDTFRRERCAMVVGTYRLTDFELNTIPPGVIDHREWTEENGRNNVLRVNGMGAPRGFWTPLLRTFNFPPTKYGEDYAVGLRICREWRIGRVYDVMYNCRRWECNSDGALDVEKVNINNFYKDKIRTWEIRARIRQNQK